MDMKRLFCLLVTLASVTIGFSQSLSDLERNPSFKGITIGAPISKYSNILKFKNSSRGKTAYTITDSKYYSIFNISVDNAVVLEKDGVVNAVLLSKTFRNSNNDLSELKILQALESDLTSKYGGPNVNISDPSRIPAVFGVRWRSRTIYIDIALIDEDKPELQYFLYQKEEDY